MFIMCCIDHMTHLYMSDWTVSDSTPGRRIGWMYSTNGRRPGCMYDIHGRRPR